jgi:hypothetical protein
MMLTEIENGSPVLNFFADGLPGTLLEIVECECEDVYKEIALMGLLVLGCKEAPLVPGENLVRLSFLFSRRSGDFGNLRELVRGGDGLVIFRSPLIVTLLNVELIRLLMNSVNPMILFRLVKSTFGFILERSPSPDYFEAVLFYVFEQQNADVQLNLLLGLLLHCLGGRVPSENVLRSIHPFLHELFSGETPTLFCRYSSKIMEKDLASVASGGVLFSFENCDEIVFRFDQHYCVDPSNSKLLISYRNANGNSVRLKLPDSSASFPQVLRLPTSECTYSCGSVKVPGTAFAECFMPENLPAVGLYGYIAFAIGKCVVGGFEGVSKEAHDRYQKYMSLNLFDAEKVTRGEFAGLLHGVAFCHQKDELVNGFFLQFTSAVKVKQIDVGLQRRILVALLFHAGIDISMKKTAEISEVWKACGRISRTLARDHQVLDSSAYSLRLHDLEAKLQVLLKAKPPRLALKDVLETDCLYLEDPLTCDEIKAILVERKSNCELLSFMLNFVLSLMNSLSELSRTCLLTPLAPLLRSDIYFNECHNEWLLITRYFLESIANPECTESFRRFLVSLVNPSFPDLLDNGFKQRAFDEMISFVRSTEESELTEAVWFLVAHLAMDPAVKMEPIAKHPTANSQMFQTWFVRERQMRPLDFDGDLSDERMIELSAYWLRARPPDSEGELVFRQMFVDVGHRTESALELIQCLRKSLDFSSESREILYHTIRNIVMSDDRSAVLGVFLTLGVTWNGNKPDPSLFVIERDDGNLFRRFLETREFDLLEAAFYGFLLVVLQDRANAVTFAETVGIDVLLDYSLNSTLEREYHSISSLREFLFDFNLLPDEMTFKLLRGNGEVHENLIKCLTCEDEFISDRLCPKPSFYFTIDVSHDRDFRVGFLAYSAVVDSFVRFVFDAGQSTLTSDLGIDAIHDIPEFNAIGCGYFNRTVFFVFGPKVIAVHVPVGRHFAAYFAPRTPHSIWRFHLSASLDFNVAVSNATYISRELRLPVSVSKEMRDSWLAPIDDAVEDIQHRVEGIQQQVQGIQGRVEDIQQEVRDVRARAQDIHHQAQDLHSRLEDEETLEEDEEEEDLPGDNPYARDIDVGALLAAAREDEDYEAPEEEASDIESVTDDDYYNDSDYDLSDNSSTGARQTHECQKVVEGLLFIGQIVRVDRTRAKLLVQRFPEKWTWRHERFDGQLGEVITATDTSAKVKIGAFEVEYDVRLLAPVTPNPIAAVFERPCTNELTRFLAIRLARASCLALLDNMESLADDTRILELLLRLAREFIRLDVSLPTEPQSLLRVFEKVLAREEVAFELLLKFVELIGENPTESCPDLLLFAVGSDVADRRDVEYEVTMDDVSGFCELISHPDIDIAKVDMFIAKNKLSIKFFQSDTPSQYGLLPIRKFHADLEEHSISGVFHSIISISQLLLNFTNKTFENVVPVILDQFLNENVVVRMCYFQVLMSILKRIQFCEFEVPERFLEFSKQFSCASKTDLRIESQRIMIIDMVLEGLQFPPLSERRLSEDSLLLTDDTIEQAIQQRSLCRYFDSLSDIDKNLVIHDCGLCCSLSPDYPCLPRVVARDWVRHFAPMLRFSSEHPIRQTRYVCEVNLPFAQEVVISFSPQTENATVFLDGKRVQDIDKPISVPNLPAELVIEFRDANSWGFEFVGRCERSDTESQFFASHCHEFIDTLWTFENEWSKDLDVLLTRLSLGFDRDRTLSFFDFSGRLAKFGRCLIALRLDLIASFQRRIPTLLDRLQFESSSPISDLILSMSHHPSYISPIC